MEEPGNLPFGMRSKNRNGVSKKRRRGRRLRSENRMSVSRSGAVSREEKQLRVWWRGWMASMEGQQRLLERKAREQETVS